jgi:hypothetical protein
MGVPGHCNTSDRHFQALFFDCEFETVLRILNGLYFFERRS